MPGTRTDPPAAIMRRWLVARLSHYFRLDRQDIDGQAPLVGYGLDSVIVLSLYGDIESEFALEIEPTDIWDHETVDELADFLSARAEQLDNHEPGEPESPLPEGDAVAFAFTGQGCQHPGMAAGLYEREPRYRHFLDEVASTLRPYLRESVADLILDADPRLAQPAFAQPALFAVEYALARTLTAEGVRPVAVLGHGLGEYAAAVTAGALTMPEAAKLVAVRAALIQQLPAGGGMLATTASPELAAECAAAEPQVTLAAVNGSRATVLSGELAALRRVAAWLDRAHGVTAIPLAVPHAYQSPQMEPVRSRFREVAQRVPGRAPAVPYYSSVRGRFTAEPLYSAYWCEQLTARVRFADAARALLAQQNPGHLVEIGPRRVLTPLLRRIAGARGPACVGVCAGPDTTDLGGLLTSLGGAPATPALAAARTP